LAQCHCRAGAAPRSAERQPLDSSDCAERCSASHSRSVILHSIAIEVAEELADTWPEGEGFGSSDGTYVVKDFLDRVIMHSALPYKTGWVDHRLAVIENLPGS